MDSSKHHACVFQNFLQRDCNMAFLSLVVITHCLLVLKVHHLWPLFVYVSDILILIANNDKSFVTALRSFLDEHFKFVICRIPWRRRERVQLINYTLQILWGLQGREVMVKRKLNELIICVGWNLRLLNLYIACLSSLLNPLYKCVQRYFF